MLIFIVFTLSCTALTLSCTGLSKNLIIRSVVVNIIDGDTITIIQKKNKKLKCRLAGIDAPEKHQAYGKTSKKHLSNLVYQKTVYIIITSIDQYKRAICWIVTSDGLNVNLEQIKQGMAWVYRHYTKNVSLYEAEKQAKKEKCGLWSDNNPIAPWDYRKKLFK